MAENFTLKNALVFSKNTYKTVDVVVQEGLIAAIAPTLEGVGECIDATHKLLLPGFVNAHTHSPELWQRGLISPRPLELWIAELYDFTPLSPEQVYLGALGTAVETLLSGGTTVVDHLVLIPGQELATVEAAVRAYRDAGIRAFVGPLIQDKTLGSSIPSNSQACLDGPPPLNTAEVLAILEESVQTYHDPAAGIAIMVAPTGLQLCSDTLIEGCVDLSDRYHLCRHTHLLETKAQYQLAYQRYGHSAAIHLEKLGFLGPRTSLAHCVWLEDADIQALAASGSTVVHNPLSNLRLGSGIAPILKCLQAGVNVTFGCDGSASNDSQDLLEAIKIGTLLHNTTDFDYRHWFTPHTAVTMASLGGARGLGLADQLGSLTPGKAADLVLYDLSALSLLPRTDPIGLLVMGRPTNAVHSVWIQGRPIIRDGQLLTIDVAALRQALFSQSEWQSARTSPTMEKMEPIYRQVMGLPAI